MLKGISPLLSPELLKILSEMGHGDELVIADRNFPSVSICNRVIRADASDGASMLKAILSVFPLDQYDNQNVGLMEVCPGDTVVPHVWDTYLEAVKSDPSSGVYYLERFAYKERAKRAYAVIATGETAQYANIILKKGCVLK